MSRAGCIMVQGTMSGAGKSLLCAALCRIFAQDGYKTAPFKSQNMALNSFVTRDGLEMGRAQVVQAQAAGVEPDVRMNPILLKPSSNVGSQVIVNGEVRGDMPAKEYFRRKKSLIPDILRAYDSLADEFDIIVIEGAGSPAEINLKADDIVNMGLAKLVDAPVLLAGDIDRGGVFAQLYGTVALLEPDERARIRGLIINKFRGDVEILRPGLAMLEEKTQLPVLGVVPYLRVDIEDEDSLAPRLQSKSAVKPLDAAVLKLPHISNFTDFMPLEQHPLLGVRYVQSVRELGAPDLVILPGTKNTVNDLLWLRQSGLEARDTALCTRMTYGVVQNRTLLDYYIDHWCTQKAARLEPVVACLLRLGIYQILFMDKVPDRAAVHETVELTKRRGKTRAAGMINAVLRKCASSKNTLPPLPQNSFISKAAVQYSHPRWLVERLTALVGEQEAEAFLRLDNEPVPTVIQVNPLKTTPAELENALRSDGVRLVPHPWLEGCFEVTGTGDLERLSAFASGRCTVQDAAARLAAIAAGPKPGNRVLDVCAAPGGKSFAMAMQMKNRGDILSCDIHPHKLKLIENGAARLGITIIRTALADGRERHAGWVEQADVVLADVPCSGLGIIRKKPDIRWKDPAQLAQLPAVQLSILNNVSAYVRPGGVLVYATCTVLPEENGGVVSAFLDVHPDFAKEEFTLPGIGSCPGDVTLWPQRTGTDGFYICRMRRRG